MPTHSTGPQNPASSPLAALGRRALIPMLFVTALIASIALTIVVSALPALQTQLEISGTSAAWTLTIALISSAVAAPIVGRLGDMFGHQRVLLVCLGCFVVGTTVAGIALEVDSFAGLLTGRALQGISSGVFPLAFGIIRAAAPPERLPGEIALLSGMLGIGSAVGMVVAGFVIDGLGTSWLFWGTLIPTIPAMALLALAPAVSPRRGHGRVDLIGMGFLAGALVCLLLVISQGNSWGWGSPRIFVLAVAAVALAVSFVAAELRAEDPLVNLRLLRNRTFALLNAATFMVAVSVFGTLTLIPSFVQTNSGAGYGFGLSASEAGLVFIPIAIAMVIASPLAGWLGVGLNTSFPIRGGVIISSFAFALLAVANGRVWVFYACGALIGLGYGLMFAALGSMVVMAVSPEETGLATGMNTITRTVAGAVGAQLAAAILSGSGSPIPTESGYSMAFACFAVVALTVLAISSAIPVRWRRLQPAFSKP